MERPSDAGDHVYHLFVVRTEERDALRAHLAEWGVASAVHYPEPIHLTEAYADLGLGPGSLPVCERLSRADLHGAPLPRHERRRAGAGFDGNLRLHKRRPRNSALIGYVSSLRTTEDGQTGLGGWGAPMGAVRQPARIVPRPAPIGAAVVGCGYWGPNLARNLEERPEFDLEFLCDRDPAQRAAFTRRFPHVRTSPDLGEVLDDPAVEAILIATPPQSHYALAKAALEAGKHVLVEKPLATNVADARELAELADIGALVLMPGHTFIYSPAVNAVRDLIRRGDLGDIHFVTSSRMNLGKYQADGVVCDLAPHDLSILLYWLEQSDRRGRRRRAAACSSTACRRPRSSRSRSPAARPPTCRSRGWLRARCAR